MPHIFQINISQGGVPKTPVYSAIVTELGIEGDKQKHTEIHGGVERALCIFSLEIILQLQKEGHPIFPGSTGENITITGLDWDLIQPGQKLKLGSEVEIEFTRPTTPCKTIRPSFSDNNSNRIHEDMHPGWSRYYARILKTGEIKTGDKIEVL